MPQQTNLVLLFLKSVRYNYEPFFLIYSIFNKVNYVTKREAQNHKHKLIT